MRVSIVLASAFALVTLLAVRASWAEAPGPGASALEAETHVSDAAQAPVAVPEPSAKALRYYRSGNVLWVVATLWGLIVPALLLFTGVSARMRDLAVRLGGRWLLVVICYAVLFSLVSFVLDLPLAYYSEFTRQHAYGLSNQTLAKWVHDTLISLLVSIVISAIVLPGVYFFLKKSPAHWWLWSGLAAVPFIVLMVLIEPIWIAPLFNRFGPMKDKTLEAEILALADRAGIQGSRVFEVEKSVDTKAVNAYVAGFGETKRIVLWDTIIAKLDRRELLFVMGHEMGHYVLGHIPRLIGMLCLLVLVTFYLAHRVAGGVIHRFQGRIGFSVLSDVASLPLILLLAGVFSLLVTPLILAYSRSMEHEADRFGLELTRDNHDAATAFVRLQQENLGIPWHGWLYKTWRDSHPPLGERIEFCNTYHPWQTGQPLKYGRLFRAQPEQKP